MLNQLTQFKALDISSEENAVERFWTTYISLSNSFRSQGLTRPRLSACKSRSLSLWPFLLEALHAREVFAKMKVVKTFLRNSCPTIAYVA